MYAAQTPSMLQKASSLFDYLELLNTSFGTMEPGPCSSQDTTQEPDLHEYAAMPDSQDPYDAAICLIPGPPTGPPTFSN
jgi:hypothetical protein